MLLSPATPEVEEEAEERSASTLGEPHTRQLIEAIDKLETFASVRDLRPLLQV